MGNHPTPMTPCHPSVVEATELLPDLFEPLPTCHPLHRPWLLWKWDMASLGLLELLLLNKKWDMDSLGLGLPTRRTTPLLPLPMEFIVANVKLPSMALPTRLVGLLWVTLSATTQPVATLKLDMTASPIAILGVMVPATLTPLPEGFSIMVY